jgi:hypothetical protein
MAESKMPGEMPGILCSMIGPAAEPPGDFAM